MAKSAFQIQIEKDKKLFKKLNGMKNAVDKQIKNTVLEHTLLLETQAKKNLTAENGEHPFVKSGRLINSVTHEVGLEKGELTGKVGSVVEYGPSLEFGTSRHPAYPWLFPALRAIQPGYLKDLKKFVPKSILSWWRK